MDSSRRAVESYWRSQMIDGATLDEDKLTPVYKLEEICDLLRSSHVSIVKEVSEFIFKLLDHKSPVVKQKVGRRKAGFKGADSVPGTPLDSGVRLRLPDKKSMEFILDKLQKNALPVFNSLPITMNCEPKRKDTYGVYAEPVDPEEFPDYHDVIEHPMDFATVRTKLGRGLYTTLEQFEAIRAALKKLEQGNAIEDAKDICEYASRLPNGSFCHMRSPSIGAIGVKYFLANLKAHVYDEVTWSLPWQTDSTEFDRKSGWVTSK